MKELIQLFKEAYIEVKRKPLEALFTLFTLLRFFDNFFDD